MKNRIAYICLLLLVGFLLSSCFAGSCSFFEFYYPVNSGDDSWEYLGKIVVTSNKPGSDFDISDKIARITIRDRKKRKFLSETIKFPNCGGIYHDFEEVKWEKFEELELMLYEEIDQGSKMNENGSTIKKYPLCKLKFEYNEKKRKFYLTKKEDLGGFAKAN